MTLLLHNVVNLLQSIIELQSQSAFRRKKEGRREVCVDYNHSIIKNCSKLCVRQVLLVMYCVVFIQGFKGIPYVRCLKLKDKLHCITLCSQCEI